jgi:hypothetical protein
METPQNYNDILARVESFNSQVKEAKALKEAGATSVPEEDPRNKGEKGVPTLDETDDTNKTRNDKSNEDTKLEDESTHPTRTGKNVPSTQDGNAKEDAFTEPTTPLGKIASVNARVAAVQSRIANFQKGASTPATSAPATTAPKTTPSKAPASKEANTELAGDYSDDFLRKLAFAICETEGGLEAVEPILLKHAGQEEARELMKRASEEYDYFVQLTDALQHEEMLKLAYESESIAAANEMLKNASEEEREQIIKFAEVHFTNVEDYADPMLKLAYMAGAGDAATMMDAQEGAPEGEEAGLPGAAQGEPSIEELVQLLDAMVASGEIDEATAAQVVEQLAGAPEGGEMMPPEGGDPMAADPMAAAGGVPEGMVAEASADALCEQLIKQPK